MTNGEYRALERRLRADTEDSGVKLDLDSPCDRAIISECGLTPEEAFEFLAHRDTMLGTTEDETVRVRAANPRNVSAGQPHGIVGEKVEKGLVHAILSRGPRYDL